MPKRLLWWNSKLDDCVEPVALGDGIAYKIVNPELRALIENYVQVDMVKMPHPRPYRFPGSVPVSIFRSQLPILKQGLHLWAPKTKGTRYRFVGLKLCSDVAFVDQSESSAVESAAAAEKVSETIENQILAALPVPENTISLIGNKKKYKKKKKNLITVLEEEEQLAINDNTVERQALIEKLKIKVAKYQAEQKHKDGDDSDAEDDEDAENGEDYEDDDYDDEEDDVHDEFKLSSHKTKENNTANNASAPANNAESTSQGIPVTRTIKAIQYLHAFMDRSNDIYVLPSIGLPESVYPILLDGEMAFHKPTQTHHYLVFNISISNGYRYSFWAYQDRVKEYFELCKLFHISSAPEHKSPITNIVAKQQRFWHEYDIVYNEYKFGEYACDGTVPTRNQTKAIEHGTDWESFKIKPIEEHTSDLMVGADPSGDPYSTKIYLLVGGYLKQDKLLDVDNMYPECEMDVYRYFRNRNKFSLDWIQDKRNWSGKIFESLFDSKTNDYEAIEFRHDKRHPNNARVIKYTKQNIQEGVTPEEVLVLWKQWKIEDSNQRLAQLEMAKHSNTMMEIHRSNIHEENFVDTMMCDSNWSHIGPSTISQYITSLQLSWEYKKTPDEEKLIPIYHAIESTCTDFTEEEKQQILDITGLKPINKNKRKGRKKGSTKKINESIIMVNLSKEEKRELRLQKKLLKQSKRQLEAEEEDEEEDEAGSVCFNTSLAENSIDIDESRINEEIATELDGEGVVEDEEYSEEEEAEEQIQEEAEDDVDVDGAEYSEEDEAVTSEADDSTGSYRFTRSGSKY